MSERAAHPLHSGGGLPSPLELFLRTLSYDAVRAVDQPYYHLWLPSGKRLRAVKFGSYYLARDRKFYTTIGITDNIVRPVELIEVQARVSMRWIHDRMKGAGLKARRRKQQYNRRRRS